MIYDIRLSIRYDYDYPASEGRHHLRLLPGDAQGLQRVLATTLAVTPAPAETSAFVDFFGNQVTEVRMGGGHSTVVFDTTATVERFLPPDLVDTSPPVDALRAELAALPGLGPESPHHFRASSPRIGAFADIASYAASVAATSATTRMAVEAVGLALHRDMAFDARATTVETPPDTAFAQRRGVCQDFAQVMIAALRGIGIPAGYVSGFLRTVPPPGQPRLEGADAMHAWVRAWCGRDTGWVEYDPTNACFVADNHVTIATGRDYGDVSPVSGILRISGGQTTSHTVDVVPRD
jgi:transglutaminase-like putative cysteine protease